MKWIFLESTVFVVENPLVVSLSHDGISQRENFILTRPKLWSFTLASFKLYSFVRNNNLKAFLCRMTTLSPSLTLEASWGTLNGPSEREEWIAKGKTSFFVHMGSWIFFSDIRIWNPLRTCLLIFNCFSKRFSGKCNRSVKLKTFVKSQGFNSTAIILNDSYSLKCILAQCTLQRPLLLLFSNTFECAFASF